MYSMISMHISYLTKGSHILLQICTSTFKPLSIPTHLILDQPNPALLPDSLQGGSTPGVRPAEISFGGSLRLQAAPGLPVGSLLVNIDKPGIKGPNQQNSVSQSRNALSAVQYRTYIGCLDGIGTWMDGIWMESGWNLDGIWMEYGWHMNELMCAKITLKAARFPPALASFCFPRGGAERVDPGVAVTQWYHWQKALVGTISWLMTDDSRFQAVSAARCPIAVAGGRGVEGTFGTGAFY